MDPQQQQPPSTLTDPAQLAPPVAVAFTAAAAAAPAIHQPPPTALPSAAQSSPPPAAPPIAAAVAHVPSIVPKLPKKRTRTGCLTCRKRKHKCGEEKPACARCLRAGMECVWPSSSHPSSSSSAPASGITAGSAAGRDKVRPYPAPARRAGSSSSTGSTSASGDPHGLGMTRLPMPEGEHAHAGAGAAQVQAEWLTAAVGSGSTTSTSSPRQALHPAGGLPAHVYFGALHASHPELFLPEHVHGLHQSHPQGHMDNSFLQLLNSPTYPPISPFGPMHSEALSHIEGTAAAGPSRLGLLASPSHPSNPPALPGTAPAPAAHAHFVPPSPGANELQQYLSAFEHGAADAGALGSPAFLHAWPDGQALGGGESEKGAQEHGLMDWAPGARLMDGRSPSPAPVYAQAQLLSEQQQQQPPQAQRNAASLTVDKHEPADDERSRHAQQQVGPPLPRYTTPTSSLVLLFPNPQERHLMQHFLYSIPALFVGIPASTPGELSKLATEEHPNLNSFFPFLDIPHFLSLPRGQSPAADALALSLMSVGAGRLAHLYHSASEPSPSPSASSLAEVVRARGDEPCSSASASISSNHVVDDNAKRYAQLSTSLMHASLGLGQTSLAFARLASVGSGRGTAGGMDDTDLTHLLAACTTCVLARCLMGGRAFEGALDLARNVVEFEGGPKRMLDKASLTALDGNSSGGGLGAPPLALVQESASTTKPTRKKRLRMLRSVLEDLASWDLFASLSTGAPPSAFSSSSPHGVTGAPGGGLAEWLFAYCPPSGTREGRGGGEEDWETLESTLGFSRILMDLFSRVNVLYASSRSPPPNCTPSQVTTLATQLLHEIRIRQADVLRLYPELAQPEFPPPPALHGGEEMEAYRRRVRFGRLGEEEERIGRGKARRLQFGDIVWCLTLEVMVRVEVQGEPSDAEDITALALRVVALVQEAHRRSLVTLGFLWPLIIAGSMLDGEQSRASVREAIETLRSYTCFDLQSGQEILREVWDARDAGNAKASFRDVAPRCGAVVL